MTKFISKELWKGDVEKVVIRDKGKFVKHKSRKIGIPKKEKIDDSVDVDKIQITNKYIIFESDKLRNLRGQVVGRWYFKKGFIKQSVIGVSYLSTNVKKDVKKLINQSRINAYAKSDIIGSPTVERMLSISFKYIIKI